MNDIPFVRDNSYKSIFVTREMPKHIAITTDILITSAMYSVTTTLNKKEYLRLIQNFHRSHES